MQVCPSLSLSGSSCGEAANSLDSVMVMEAELVFFLRIRVRFRVTVRVRVWVRVQVRVWVWVRVRVMLRVWVNFLNPPRPSSSIYFTSILNTDSGIRYHCYYLAILGRVYMLMLVLLESGGRNVSPILI